MAGPLSSEEIEDVVSSVRRLVSNEQRPRTLSRDLGADKLVLTSAYRIVPETSPLSPLMLDAPLIEPAVKPEPASAEPVVEEPAVVSGSLTAAQEDSLAHALALEPEPELTLKDDGPVDPVGPEAALSDTVEAEWEDEIWAEPGTVSLGEAALAAEEAEVLIAPDAETEAAMSGTAADDQAAPGDADGGNWVEDQPIPFVPLRRRAEDLAARLAAGAVVEPSAAALSDDPPPVSQPQPDMPQLESGLYDADGTPLAVLDEAALGEIVRQVLRAELQGELGERITRNVRKLVRAEINRALLARDLD